MTTSIVVRVDAGLVEQPLGRLHREVADVLVGGRDVLAAQAELLDDRPAPGCPLRVADLGSGHPAAPAGTKRSRRSPTRLTSLRLEHAAR